MIFSRNAESEYIIVLKRYAGLIKTQNRQCYGGDLKASFVGYHKTGEGATPSPDDIDLLPRHADTHFTDHVWQAESTVAP